MAVLQPNWAARRDALIAWAGNLFGVPFHWRDDRYPFTNGDHGMLHVSSVEGAGEFGAARYIRQTPTSAPVPHYDRLAVVRVEVTLRTYSQAPGSASHDLVQLGLVKRRAESFNTALNTAGIAVIRANTPVTVNPGFSRNGVDYSQTDVEFEFSVRDTYADSDVSEHVIENINGASNELPFGAAKLTT